MEFFTTAGLMLAHGRPVVSEVLAAKPHEIETWIHDVTTGEERKQTKAEAELRWSMGQRYRGRILRRNCRFNFCRSSLARR